MTNVRMETSCPCNIYKSAVLVGATHDKLVQVYRSDMRYTMASIKKLIPMWSYPRHMVSRDCNLYVLETTGSRLIDGTFSSRRLRHFLPRTGMVLAGEQARREGGTAELRRDDERETDEAGAEEMREGGTKADEEMEWTDNAGDTGMDGPDNINGGGRRQAE